MPTSFFNAVDNCGDDDLVHLLLVGSPATTTTVTTYVERSALGHFPHLAFGILAGYTTIYYHESTVMTQKGFIIHDRHLVY